MILLLGSSRIFIIISSMGFIRFLLRSGLGVILPMLCM